MSAPIDIIRVRPTLETLALLPARTARAVGALPLSRQGDVVVVCVADRTDYAVVERVENALHGMTVEFVEPNDRDALRRIVCENYPDTASTGDLADPGNFFTHVMKRA